MMNHQNYSNNRLTIDPKQGPLRIRNTKLLLWFQWGLWLSHCYIIYSAVNFRSNNYRIMMYAVIFLLFETLQTTYKYLQIEDPLHLNGVTSLVSRCNIICIFNLFYLLLRIVIDTHNLHSILLLVHFLVTFTFYLNDLNKKIGKVELTVDKLNIRKMLSPLIVYIFAKTSLTNQSDLWIIQLILFTINIHAAIELKKILGHKECNWVGWYTSLQHQKTSLNWSKKKALRTIIITCCLMIVTQNLFLIFDTIKYEVSVTILQTLLVSTMAYILYVEHPKMIFI